MVLINSYALHLRITTKNHEGTEKFCDDLDVLLKSLKRKDIKFLGNFHSKLGCIRRGIRGFIRKRNEERQRGNAMRNPRQAKFIAVNTILKHKASHISTWEGKINQKIAYNEIDYLAIASCCKFSVINAGSYKVNKVETNLKLVAV